MQGIAGAGDVDGSTKVIRITTQHTPTRQVQPFQRQLPIERDIKVPPIPARLEHDAGSQLEDADTAAICHLLWLGIQILRIHLAASRILQQLDSI